MFLFIKELWAFMRVRKRCGSPPILLMVLIAALLVLAQGSVMAPFVYTLF